eukprot:m.424290 g.424290  ORF g.424290 m.424290 type:complete len:557 (+) comp20212_c1_seq25:1312-2982(+)
MLVTAINRHIMNTSQQTNRFLPSRPRPNHGNQQKTTTTMDSRRRWLPGMQQQDPWGRPSSAAAPATRHRAARVTLAGTTPHTRSQSARTSPGRKPLHWEPASARSSASDASRHRHSRPSSSTSSVSVPRLGLCAVGIKPSYHDKDADVVKTRASEETVEVDDAATAAARRPRQHLSYSKSAAPRVRSGAKGGQSAQQTSSKPARDSQDREQDQHEHEDRAYPGHDQRLLASGSPPRTTILNGGYRSQARNAQQDTVYVPKLDLSSLNSDGVCQQRDDGPEPRDLLAASHHTWSGDLMVDTSTPRGGGGNGHSDGGGVGVGGGSGGVGGGGSCGGGGDGVHEYGGDDDEEERPHHRGAGRPLPAHRWAPGQFSARERDCASHHGHPRALRFPGQGAPRQPQTNVPNGGAAVTFGAGQSDRPRAHASHPTSRPTSSVLRSAGVKCLSDESRVRFLCRLTSSGASVDQKRSLSGFFFPAQRAVTVYEFRLFGKRSVILPMLQMSPCSTQQPGGDWRPCAPSDVAPGAILRCAVEGQACVPAHLQRMPCLDFEVTELTPG